MMVNQQQQQQPSTKDLLLLEQQAEQAYRNAPGPPDCSLFEHALPARLLVRANSTTSSTDTDTSSTDDTTEEETVTSWANFPVCMRTEQHPSMLSLDVFFSQHEKQQQREPLETEELPVENNNNESELFIAPEQLLKLSRMVAYPEAVDDAPPTSFGWGDFPLLVQAAPSFDYPWRYHKTDQDEEIVPLVAPLHQRTTASTELTSATAPSLEIGATSNTVSSAPFSRRRQVSFSLVRIREYSECLGDHPWCPQYPCSLDWTYNPHETLVDMDVYEQARDTCCWSTAPRRMDVLERRCRLARAMRITKAAVDGMEAYRQQQQQAVSEPPPCDDIHVPRVPTMIVLPPPDKNQRLHSPDVSFLELEVKEEKHERRCNSSSSTQRRHREWI